MTPITCKRCDKQFDNISRVIQHLSYKTKCTALSPEKDIDCDTLIAEYREFKTKMMDDKRTCSKCNNKFKTADTAKRHEARCKIDPTSIVQKNNSNDDANIEYSTVNNLIDSVIHKQIINYYIDQSFITPAIFNIIDDNLYKFRSTLDLYRYMIEIKWFNPENEEMQNIYTHNAKLDVPFRVFDGNDWVSCLKRPTIANICTNITRFCAAILSNINKSMTVYNVMKVYDKYKFYDTHLSYCRNKTTCGECLRYHIHKNNKNECTYYSEYLNDYHKDTSISCKICDEYNSHSCDQKINICKYCIKFYKYRSNYHILSRLIVVQAIVELDKFGIKPYKDQNARELYYNIHDMFYVLSRDKQNKLSTKFLNTDIDEEEKEQFKNFLKIYEDNCESMLESSELMIDKPWLKLSDDFYDKPIRRTFDGSEF